MSLHYGPIWSWDQSRPEAIEAHRKYGQNWESKFRQKYEDEMINKFDMHFFVGTVHKHPGAWIIVGLFYPPPRTMDDLFG
jgi:hypothetical protein